MAGLTPRLTAQSSVPPWGEIQAPDHWRCVDFISDLHLQASEPVTFDAWRTYMQSTRADAMFILGDLFEVWVGDDIVAASADELDPSVSFENQCAQVLQSAADRLDIFFMHGNRDFLLGPAFAGNCRMTLLEDPTRLDFGGHRWLLSHGDALCLADTDYMQFRAQVRSAQWQQDFLGKPLTERRTIALGLRQQSETRKRSGTVYADLDPQASCEWLQAAQAQTLIHGHTHKPGQHDLGNGQSRIVLSDWDAAAIPPRAEVVRLTRQPTHTVREAMVQRMPATQARL